MGYLDGIRRLFRIWTVRPDPERELEEEFEHHLAQTERDLIAEGRTPERAAAEARARLGDMETYRDRILRIDRRRVAMRKRAEWWDVVVGGLGGAVRGIRRYPGFAAGVILTLGLGIGVNSAMFGIVDRILLRPPEHVVDHQEVKRIYLERSFLGIVRTGSSLTWPDFEDLQTVPGFEHVAAFTSPAEYTVGSGPDAGRVSVRRVSHDLFPLLGAQPRLGRFFAAEEDEIGAAPTAVLSWEHWRSAYGGDPDVLGRSLELSGTDFTVIGVAPQGFTGTELQGVDVWVPIAAGQYALTGNDGWKDNRGWWWINTVARMGEGASVEAAEDQATALHRNARSERIEQGHYDPEARIVTGPLIAAAGPNPSDESQVARWLGGVSLIVLIIACANVANLLLARGAQRRREVAVRLSLGISRRRLVGQMVVETLVLAAVGGGVALVLAQWGGGVIRSTLIPDVLWTGSVFELRMVAFTVGVAILAGLLAGIPPAVQSTRTNLSEDLSEGSRGSSLARSKLRSGLAMAQAALSVILLVGAGLFVRSLNEVRSLDLGLDADRLALVTLEFESRPEDEESRSTYQEARRRVERLPLVTSVAYTDTPFQWARSVSLHVSGRDSIPRLQGGGPYKWEVTPGYTETLGLSVLKGRPLRESDTGEGAEPAALVSQTTDRTLWPDEGALGQCLFIGDPEDEPPCTRVVGVVEDASRGSLEGEPFLGYYLPLGEAAGRVGGMYVRGATDDMEALVRAITPVLRSVSPRIRFAEVESLRQVLDPQARSWKLGATLFSVFGGLALLVAAIGLYSLLAFNVAQRRRELGIRSALGAGKGRLVRSVMVDGLRLAGLGVLLGVVIALATAPMVEELLFRTEPRDPAVMGGVAALLLAVAAVASLLPGLRATRVHPAEALRAE